jgi:hypothetical protein
MAEDFRDSGDATGPRSGRRLKEVYLARDAAVRDVQGGLPSAVAHDDECQNGDQIIPRSCE